MKTKKMDLLHETMIIQETPLSDEDIRQYITVEMILLIGNKDFDAYLKKHGFIVAWYIENEDYRVIEILN